MWSSRQMAVHVHPRVQHADDVHERRIVRQRVEHDVLLDRQRAISHVDIGTGHAEERRLGQTKKGCVDFPDGGIGLVVSPHGRRVVPDVQEVAPGGGGKLYLRHGGAVWAR